MQEFIECALAKRPKESFRNEVRDNSANNSQPPWRLRGARTIMNFFRIAGATPIEKYAVANVGFYIDGLRETRQDNRFLLGKHFEFATCAFPRDEIRVSKFDCIPKKSREFVCLIVKQQHLLT